MTCPDCGHSTYLHRANGVTQNVRLDEPVPCYAVVAVEQHPAGDNMVTFRYRYCECTTIHPIRPGDGL